MFRINFLDLQCFNSRNKSIKNLDLACSLLIVLTFISVYKCRTQEDLLCSTRNGQGERMIKSKMINDFKTDIACISSHITFSINHNCSWSLFWKKMVLLIGISLNWSIYHLFKDPWSPEELKCKKCVRFITFLYCIVL